MKAAELLKTLTEQGFKLAVEHSGIRVRPASLLPCYLREAIAGNRAELLELLQAGVDCSVIALWLGHESVETTQTYLHAHLALKEAALARLKPYERGKRTRFQPNDRLLAFLEAL